MINLIEIILIGFLFIFAATLGGCATLIRGEPPSIDVKIWSGDFTKAVIERRQDKVQIRCDDPEFSDYVAMTYEDFERIIRGYAEACEKWKPR